MINQSLEIITKPAKENFDKHKNGGNLIQSVVYVAIGSVVSSLLIIVALLVRGFPFGGLFGDLIFRGVIQSLIFQVVSFVVFAGVTYYVVKQQSGEADINELGYSFALFFAPLTIIMGIIRFLVVVLSITLLPITLVTILFASALAFFGYLALHSLTNLTDTTKIWLSSGAGALGYVLIHLLTMSPLF